MAIENGILGPLNNPERQPTVEAANEHEYYRFLISLIYREPRPIWFVPDPQRYH